MATAPKPDVAFDCPDLRQVHLIEGVADPRDDRPAYADEWAALLGQCRVALARREKSYPAMIKAGTIDRDDAAADFAAWRNLVDEWTWIVTGQGSAPPASTLSARKAAVDLALNRIADQLQTGRRTDEIEIQQMLNQALAWHLARTRFGAPAVHFCAAINHQFEADRKGKK